MNSILQLYGECVVSIRAIVASIELSEDAKLQMINDELERLDNAKAEEE